MSNINSILQDYVATANDPKANGDWNLINSKFKKEIEEHGWDVNALKDYVATANDPKAKGNWSIINSKFPEFDTDTRKDAATKYDHESYTKDEDGNQTQSLENKFLQVSSAIDQTTAWHPTKGIEEKVVPFLRDVYSKNATGEEIPKEDRIKFEETGWGNNVKITLPGQDYGATFNLPNAKFDQAGAQEAWRKIKNYVSSEKKNPMTTKLKADVGDIISKGGRTVDVDNLLQEAGLGTGEEYVEIQKKINEGQEITEEERVKYSSAQFLIAKEGVARGGLFQRDENIAKDLSSLFQGIEGAEGITFEAVDHLSSKVKVTLAGNAELGVTGAERIIDVSKGNEHAARQVINFIEADPIGYKESKKFLETKSTLDDKVLNKITQLLGTTISYDEDKQELQLGAYPGKTMKLQSSAFSDVVKSELMEELGETWWEGFFTPKQLKNISRDDIAKLIDQRTGEIIGLHGEKMTDSKALQYVKKQKRDGKSSAEIAQGIVNRNIRFIGGNNDVKSLRQAVAVHGQKIDKAATEEEKQKLFGILEDPDDPTSKVVEGTGFEMPAGFEKFGFQPGERVTLQQLQILRSQTEGKKFNNFFIDPVSGERTLNLDKEKGFIDLTKQVNDGVEAVKEQKLTREELKDNFLTVNYALTNSLNEWKNKKRFWKLKDQDTKSLGNMRRQGQKPVHGKWVDGKFIRTQTKEVMGQGGTTTQLSSRDGDWYLYETDSYAKGAGAFTLDKADVRTGHGLEGRWEYLKSLKVEKEVYNRMYLLNEDMLSQKQETTSEAIVTGLKESIGGIYYNNELFRPTATDELRQSYLGVMQDLGVEATVEEENYAKTTGTEIAGRAVGSIPKLLADFTIAGRILKVAGVAQGVGKIVSKLRQSRYLWLGKPISRTQLLKNLRKTKTIEKTAAAEATAIRNFSTNSSMIAKHGAGAKSLVTGASFLNKAAAVGTLSLLEGVKMDLAMQDITGIGGLEKPPVGSSFMTGVGFGAAGQVIPWNAMWKGMAGKYADAGLRLPFTRGINVRKKLGLPGAKPTVTGDKEIAFKGFYDYLLASPVNFYIGARVGELSDALAKDMMGKKTWNNFLDEHYGDFDENMKHAISDLIMGVTMKLSHAKRFDFTSGPRLKMIKQEAYIQKMNMYERRTGFLEDDIVSKDQEGTIKTKEIPNPNYNPRKATHPQYNPKTIRVKVLKKGESIEKAEALEALERLATHKIHEMNNTLVYLDPELGPEKVYQDYRAQFEKTGETLKVVFNEKMGVNENATFEKVKDKDGKPTGEVIMEVNPYNINPGIASHELGHYGLRKEFSEDVMFKSESVQGVRKIMETVYITSQDPKTKEYRRMSLWEAFENSKVWNRHYEYEHQKVKEEEMFTFLAEHLAMEGNLNQLRRQLAYDRFAGWIENMLNVKLKHRTNLNTEKELIQWFDNYVTSIGKQKSVIKDKAGIFSQLERFIDRTATGEQRERRLKGEEKERKKRLKHEETHGQGENIKLRSEDLTKRIEEYKEDLIKHPALALLKEEKITQEEYLKRTKDIVEKIEKAERVNEMYKTQVSEIEVFPENAISTKEGRAMDSWAIKKDGKEFPNPNYDPKKPTHPKRNPKTIKEMVSKSEWLNDGYWKAYAELVKEGGIFDGATFKGISFKDGGKVYGRSREDWGNDVKFGIMGRVTKAGKQQKTVQGFEDVLKGFEPAQYNNDGSRKRNADGELIGNNSFNGYFNSRYWQRRGAVLEHYENNPVGYRLDAPIPGETGRTAAEMLEAPKDPRMERFETVNILEQQIQENRKLKEESLVKVEATKKTAKSELPISEKEFNKKDGWKQTIEKEASQIKDAAEKGQKDIGDLASNFTQKMFKVELTESQKKNPNDLGAPNLKRLQTVVKTPIEKFVEEKVIDTKTGREKIQKKLVDGKPEVKQVKVSETIADIMPDATVKFDKGVSDKLAGTSYFPRLGVLSKLYHKATAKDYTAAEMKKMGYDVNPKLDKDGAYRVATGPGGNIWLKGPAKGKDITGRMIEDFLGINKDGTLQPGKSSLYSAGRRIMDVVGGRLTLDVVDPHIRANPEILGKANTLRFLLNYNVGKSPKLFSESLEMFDKDLQAEFMRGIAEKEFAKLWANYAEDGNANPLGRALRDYFTSRTVHGEMIKEYTAFNKGDIKWTKDRRLKLSKDLLKIGKDLQAKLNFEGVHNKITALRARVARHVYMPQSLRAIEKHAPKRPGDKEGPRILKTGEIYDIKSDKNLLGAARHLDKLLMDKFEKEYGKNWYETFLLLGNTEGTGVGGSRKAYYATAEIARTIAKNIETTKDYTGLTRANSNRYADSAKLREYINLSSKHKNISESKVKEVYEHGEVNKAMLREIVAEIKDLYDSKLIDSGHVRMWLENAGGPTSGILRKSASLAMIPIGKNAELFKLFPEKVAKIDSKTGKPKRYKEDKINKQGGVLHKKGDIIYEQGWVLEHTIPTQFVKARIYEYILSGETTKNPGEMYSRMDLTLKDFHTTYIPKKLDKMVNVLNLSELSPEFKPGMNPLEWRYYRNAHPADFNLALRDVIRNRDYDLNPQWTITRKQAQHRVIREANRKVFKGTGLEKAFSKKLNSEMLDDAAKIDQAMMKARLLKKEKKGISVWDFDDTIATTKSGVLAKIPNMSGKPMPKRKVIFMAGGPGAGKSSVIKGLGLEKQGFKIVNQDIALQWLAKNNGLPKDMRDFTPEQRSKWSTLQWEARNIAQKKQMKFQGKGDGIIVDGTGQSSGSMMAQRMEFQRKGYDVSMLYVETSLPTALARNKARKERSLTDKIVERTWKSVDFNKREYKRDFGENFIEVKTDNLKFGDPLPKDVIDKANRFTRSYEKKRLTAEEFANRGKEILDKGGEFDFSEFEMVREGEPGPFFEKFVKRMKKYGPKDNFILTARPKESAENIHMWLKMEGYEIPLENIKALGNSTAEAKALWIAKKYGEGYNDFYFADDAIANVKEVKNVLNQLDVKSKVQQAKKLFSQNLGQNINNIMEHSLGIESEKVFSKAEAKTRGKDIKRRRFFITDSAADLELLIEPLYGKGDKGIKNKKWFSDNFIQPWERGIRDYNTARQTVKNDYMGLRKQNKDVVKKLNKPVEETNFTHDMAMRVYLWNKAGYKIPDLAKTTETKLVNYIKNNTKLKAYAETFGVLTKQKDGLKEPSAEWWGETLAGEISNIGRGISRKQYLQDFIDIKNQIFSEKNLNKMESKLGTRWRENIEDMFDRMETGRTRSITTDRGSAMMMGYLNGSVGTIMNFNTRSAALQTISTLNFLNMRENNPIAAAKAMGNIPQFSKDFLRIMNSDMLKQRRDGLEINVTEAEIASAAAGSKNPIQSIIAKVLKVGYLPTKLADSFAISFGGATFYRNRIKMYEKQGMKNKEAEKQAWLDFQTLSERTQQSSRPDLLSRQQTSLAGRIILPFANTPLQMNRAGMKDILDISKGRYKGGRELSEKMGRISYYMGAQVAIFAGLQSALFAMLLNDDDVTDEKIAKTKTYTLNTISDSFLRGMGISGAVASGFKNATIQYFKQQEKGFTADYSEVGEALLNISPPIGSKFSKLDQAGNIMKWAKIKGTDEFKFELGNPSLEASTLVVEAIANIPLNRAYKKTNNIKHSLNTDYENWQRAHMLGGYTPWSVGIEFEDEKKKDKRRKTRTRKPRKRR